MSTKLSDNHWFRVDPRELSTILAALRFWQARDCDPEDIDREHIDTIASDDGVYPPLTNEEIDSLAERLNCVAPPVVTVSYHRVEPHVEAPAGLVVMLQLMTDAQLLRAKNDAIGTVSLLKQQRASREELLRAVIAAAYLELRVATQLHSDALDKQEVNAFSAYSVLSDIFDRG